MPARRVLSIVAGGAAIALASLAIASPASAAVLPDGQKITVVDLIFAEVGPGGDQLFDVSPADGASTAVGGVNAPFSVTAIDVNDEGVGYAVGTVESDAGPEPYLYSANAVTGVLSDPVHIVGPPGILLSACEGLDLQPNGEILVACDYNEDVSSSYIGTVTPTGSFVPFVTSGANQVPYVGFSAIAYDAVTDALWAFGDDDGTARYLVDREAGTLAPPQFSPFRVYGADFDRAGQLFVTTYDEEDADAFVLATMSTTTGERAIIGPYTVGANTLSPVWAITVWGKPALAATGSPIDALPLGLGAALLLLAGAAFVVTQRISRKAV